ncbi:Acireductone dioxygenase [Peniophora sp. CONT]|nr:Acireductone dioxygenase [Peniophora sp. CONT]
MRARYFDPTAPGDQRAPHGSGRSVSLEHLKSIGAGYWSVPVDQPDWEDKINEVAKERGYKNRDVINVSKKGLGEAYEAKLKIFFEEHMHEDEEIRYVLEGSGYFDLRQHNGSDEEWIRVQVTPGDLLVVPAGIYHRFTLDEENRIKAMRLFKEEPKWTPHNRSTETDQNPFRLGYLESLKGAVSVA